MKLKCTPAILNYLRYVGNAPLPQPCQSFSRVYLGQANSQALHCPPVDSLTIPHAALQASHLVTLLRDVQWVSHQLCDDAGRQPTHKCLQRWWLTNCVSLPHSTDPNQMTLSWDPISCDASIFKAQSCTMPLKKQHEKG